MTANTGSQDPVAAPAKSRRPVSQLIIQVGLFSWHVRLSDECHFLIRELFQADNAPVTALEARVFLGREHYEPVATVFGNFHIMHYSHRSYRSYHGVGAQQANRPNEAPPQTDEACG